MNVKRTPPHQKRLPLTSVNLSANDAILKNTSETTTVKSNQELINNAQSNTVQDNLLQYNIKLSALKSNINNTKSKLKATFNTSKSEKSAAVQTGDRYIMFKRKLSPQKVFTASAKIIKSGTTSKNNAMEGNRFVALSNEHDNKNQQSKKIVKPPPIYHASSNVLVTSITILIGNNTFHIVPLTKGTIKETKIQIYTEKNYRIISKFLSDNNKNYYTYQLKSSKGLIIVIKGIELCVEALEVKEVLEEKGFSVKNVINIVNKNKIPQPIFKVELAPEAAK